MIKMAGPRQRPSISFTDTYEPVSNETETYMLFYFDNMEFQIQLGLYEERYSLALFGFTNTFMTVNTGTNEFNMFGLCLGKDKLSDKIKYGVCVNNKINEGQECLDSFRFGEDITINIQINKSKGIIKFSDNKPFENPIEFDIHEITSFISFVNGNPGVKNVKLINYGCKYTDGDKTRVVEEAIKKLSDAVDSLVE